MPVTEGQLASCVAHAREGSFYARHLQGYPCSTRAEFQKLPTSSIRDLGEAGISQLFFSDTGGDEIAPAAQLLSSFVPESDPHTLLQAMHSDQQAGPSRMTLVAKGPLPTEEIRIWHSETIDRVLRELAAFEPRVVFGDSRALLLLAEEVDAGGVCQLPSSVELLLATGLLPDSLRLQLEKDWGSRVVEVYQRPEAVLLGVSCAEGSLHLANDLYSCEILDLVGGEPVPPGECGVLVITSLQQARAPLVRWSTGDLVEVATAACKCKRPDFPVRRLGSARDSVAFGGREAMAVDILAAAQTFAAALGGRIFYTGVRAQDLRILVEVSDPGMALPTKEYLDLRRQIGLPMDVRLVDRAPDPGSVSLADLAEVPAAQLWRLADWTSEPKASSEPDASPTPGFFSLARWQGHREARRRDSRRRALMRVLESQESM